MSSILDYLNDVHGGAGLERWFDRTQVSEVRRKVVALRVSPYADNPSTAMMRSMGLAYVNRSGDVTETFLFGSDWRPTTGPVLDVAGFSAITSVKLDRHSREGSRFETVTWNGRPVAVGLGPGDAEMEIVDGDTRLAIDLAPTVAALRGKLGQSSYKSIDFLEPLELRTTRLGAKLHLRSLGGQLRPEGPFVTDLSGSLLLQLDD
jgi:hypothetical protein